MACIAFIGELKQDPFVSEHKEKQGPCIPAVFFLQKQVVERLKEFLVLFCFIIFKERQPLEILQERLLPLLVLPRTGAVFNNCFGDGLVVLPV